MNNVVNEVPFLRTSRNFPREINQLGIELNKSYQDIANAINNRTISIFPKVNPAITGESWFINSNQGQGILRQQTLRQVYTFGNIPVASTINIPHGININNVSTFTVIRGIGLDGVGGNYFPIPFVDGGTGIFNMSVFVNSTNIVLITAASRGAVSGFILLEWMTNA
jgi:hypothetical protein